MNIVRNLLNRLFRRKQKVTRIKGDLIVEGNLIVEGTIRSLQKKN